MRLHNAMMSMALSLALIPAIAFADSSSSSSSNATSLTYPQCAQDCRQQVLTNNTTCAATDTPCLCADQDFQTALSNCAMANCSMREALTAKYIGSRQCDIPIVRRYQEVDGGTLAPFIIASILFVVRMTAKGMGLGGGWGADDFTLIVAYMLAIIVFALNASMVHYGFGMNLWDIMPLDNITKAYKRFYAFILIYKALISLAKISMCLFLLRIFQSPIFRYILYTMIALNTAIAITWILADSFHCIPVHLAWTGWAMEEQGKCINFIDSTFANGFVNIAVDAIMVAMPVWEVVKLNLSARKKVGVAVMFAMGLVLTIVGIVRVVVFSHNSSSSNPLYEMEPLNHWSVIECQIAILCACLPTTRAVIVHFFPGVLGAASSGQATNSYSHYNRYAGGNSQNMQVQSGRGDEGQEGQAQGQGGIAKTVSYAVGISGTGKKRDSFIQLKDVDEERG